MTEVITGEKAAINGSVMTKIIGTGIIGGQEN